MLILEKARKHANQLNYDRDADDIWALFKLFPVAVLVAYFNCHPSSCTGTGTQTYKEKSLYGMDGYNLNHMFASLKLSKQVGTYLDIVNILTDAFPKTSNV